MKTRKYKVTKEFMDKLVAWRDIKDLDVTRDYDYVGSHDIDSIPFVVKSWRFDDKNPIECNNRLIAIIQWVNGEDVFEVEEPHKFIVRNDTPDRYGDYYYVQSFDGVTNRVFALEGATKFDTREEAQEWANSHQVVVEIDAEGNEV